MTARVATLIGGPFDGKKVTLNCRTWKGYADTWHTYTMRMRSDRKWLGVHEGLSDAESLALSMKTRRDRAEFARGVRKTKKWVARAFRGYSL